MSKSRSSQEKNPELMEMELTDKLMEMELTDKLMEMELTDKLLGIFHLAYDHFGDPGWWPAKTRVEIIVGAVLTQQTNWNNVERAIARLERAGLLTGDERRSLAGLATGDYRELIRCTGFYNQKFARLGGLCGYLAVRHRGDLDEFFDRPTDIIREELLGLNGIGKETADSILLYAGGKPVFVIDAYTFRLMGRICPGSLTGTESGTGTGTGSPGHDYDSAQRFFMRNLPGDVKLYRDYHALIDLTAKEYCRKTPRCGGCPLRGLCAYTTGK